MVLSLCDLGQVLPYPVQVGVKPLICLHQEPALSAGFLIPDCTLESLGEIFKSTSILAHCQRF